MTTTIVYASGESGYVYCNDATYLTAARGDGGFTTSATSANVFVGQQPSYFAIQAFMTWDTSAVGSDTVSNVDFEIDGTSDSSTTDFTLEGYAYDWGSTLESADFRDSDAGIPALGSIISSFSTTAFDAGTGYNNDFGANAAFSSAVNGSGETRVVLLSSRHRTETQPVAVEVIEFQCTGNTNDARLTITHAPSVTFTYAKPDSDITTTGWATAPLWSKVDDDPDTPDGTVITGTS